MRMMTTPGGEDWSGSWSADLSEEAVLAQVVGRLRLEVGDELLDGGSPARVYRARSAEGADLVVKVLAAAPGAVEGHDLGSFLAKREQIALIRAQAPRLGAHYLPVLEQLGGAGWAAYTTPYFPSVDAAACLRDPGQGTERFFAQQDEILAALLTGGYRTASGPVPRHHLLDVHLGRFLRRLPVLHRGLPELAGPGKLLINGTLCDPAPTVLRRLVDRSESRLDRMSPSCLRFPAHGDANVRNTLIGETPADFRIIDPRGSTSQWDPVYDLAKTLFSLTVWDPMLRLGPRVRRDRDGGTPAYEIGHRHPFYPGYRAAALQYPAYLESLPMVRELVDGDPYWTERLLLTHDLHVLAEAPCRLSDRKPKPDASGRLSAPEDLALGHYLWGTLLINDLADRLSRPEPVNAHEHLALGLPAPATA